jgi:hypothetical protein
MCSLSGRCYSWSQYKSGLWRNALPDCNVAGQIGDTTNFKLLFQCSDNTYSSSETHVEEKGCSHGDSSGKHRLVHHGLDSSVCRPNFILRAVAWTFSVTFITI